MLTHLVIRNFAIIEHLEIPFREGFTVLTGETGAGKSIVINALNLVLGGRASTEVIRTDADEAVVEAVFEPSPQRLERTNAVLQSQGIETSAQLIIRRIISRAGRNKVFINGSLSTVATLAEITRGLVDISGQHEHYTLLDTDGHVNLLDAFAAHAGALEKVRDAYGKVRALRAELREIRENVRERLNRIDFLNYQLREIDDANLQPGEDEELEREIEKLRHAEKISQALRRAVELCYENDGSAAEQLAESCAQLEGAAAFDDALDPFLQRLREVSVLATDVARDLSRYAQDVDMDPARLDELMERMDRIRHLRRKHGADVETILENARQMRAELDRLTHAEELGTQLGADLDRATSHAMELAHDLSKRRRKAAADLSDRIEAELSALHMAQTSFDVAFEPRELPDLTSLQRHGSDFDAASDDAPETLAATNAARKLSARGIDAVEFLIAPNPGEDPKSLSKIASGGELSRIMLAIKSVLMERDAVETYVFDEVDTGIGGQTADVVGDKIHRTAGDHQVLCITHLPQIASRADHHYLVEKLVDGQRTQSTIRPLEDDERVEEIARMLGGTRVTGKTRDAARELLRSGVPG